MGRERAGRGAPAATGRRGVSQHVGGRRAADPLAPVDDGRDGLPNDPLPHPRLWGAFTRVLGHYARDEKLLPLEEAVRKMTSLTARRFGLDKRGEVQVGHHADLVLFDPATVIDVASFESPQQPARGIDAVWVNGVLSWRDGAATGTRAGRFVKRGARSATRRSDAPNPVGRARHEPKWPAPCARRTNRPRGERAARTRKPKGKTMKRYGVGDAKGTGGQVMPFAKAVEADGWLTCRARRRWSTAKWWKPASSRSRSRRSRT
ncbi:MAG: D-aminoacylase [Burkholderia gladioli]|nr:MAG: D-aminoacylase [Burkholderia gladioli]